MVTERRLFPALGFGSFQVPMSPGGTALGCAELAAFWLEPALGALDPVFDWPELERKYRNTMRATTTTAEKPRMSGSFDFSTAGPEPPCTGCGAGSCTGTVA